jgi:nucleoside-diphosphate-sugar epimerase
MKLLITGATGFIGSALIEYFSKTQNVYLVGMVRSMDAVSTESNIEFRLGELGSSHKMSINLNDIDVIVHTAGRAHIMSDNSINPIDEFRRINTFGTLELASLAVEAGVKRFIFLSSIKVNGEATDLGSPFSIKDIEQPHDAYGVSKHEAEIGLREISKQTDMEITIIRLPLVYGLGVKGNFNDLIAILALRVPLPLALITNNRRSLVGLDNLLSLISRCVTHPRAANQTFFVSDNYDLSTYTLLKLLGRSIEKPAILFRFPIYLLRLIAKISNMETRIQRLIGTLQVDISHTCSQLDWKPPCSVEQGLKKLKK